jgi:hypothetical protein
MATSGLASLSELVIGLTGAGLLSTAAGMRIADITQLV